MKLHLQLVIRALLMMTVLIVYTTCSSTAPLPGNLQRTTASHIKLFPYRSSIGNHRCMNRPSTTRIVSIYCTCLHSVTKRAFCISLCYQLLRGFVLEAWISSISAAYSEAIVMILALSYIGGNADHRANIKQAKISLAAS